MLEYSELCGLTLNYNANIEQEWPSSVVLCITAQRQLPEVAADPKGGHRPGWAVDPVTPTGITDIDKGIG